MKPEATPSFTPCGLVPTRRTRRDSQTCAFSRPHMTGASRPRGPPPPATPAAVPVQDRLLRLERALAAAVVQERYTDAAQLRDALAAVRGADPVLSRRDALADAVNRQDFVAAALLRDELAKLTELLARAPRADRRVDRLLILRGRADPANALRVATVSRTGTVPLGLVPAPRGAPPSSGASVGAGLPPRVFLQPTWSPTADYVAFTEVTFRVESVHGMRAVSIADSESRVVVMNAFDGSIVKAVRVRKPPFFYSWSPCGKTLTMLSNDPTSSTPKVAMSALQVVAPAGGAAADLDAVHGPLASAHPLLYDFCPRDSTRVVAHLGNVNTVCVVPIRSDDDAARRNLSSRAGSFGAPQWHPLAGADGREVVLFVEQEPSKRDEKRTRSTEKPEGIAGMRSIFTPVETEEREDVDDGSNNNADGSDGPKPSTLDSLLGSGGSMLENLFRQGARRLGFKDASDTDKGNDGSGTQENAPGSDDDSDRDQQARGRPSEIESELGQRIAGGLLRLLPERQSSGRGSDKWSAKSESTDEDKAVNRLVMCDVSDPTVHRVLSRFTGTMAFKLSPDGRKLVTMITDPATGQDELTLCTGEFSPDTVAASPNGGAGGSTGGGGARRRARRGAAASAADIILSTPNSRVLAFFWSPDSRRLLFLSSVRGSRVGAAQWATFDTDTNRVVRYERFVLSGIYIHCLNFFDQFAASMTPWSPDSRAFCYPGRRLSDAEKQRDATAPAPAPSSPLLAALLLQRENAGESKGFSAWVQPVPDTTKGKTVPADPAPVVENVEFASWSPC